MGKISLWDLGEDARKLKDSLIHIETDKRKYKTEIHSWIINHLFDGASCEDIARQLSSVFDKDYNIMLTAVYARKEEVNKRIAAANLIKLDLESMPEYVTHYYTPDEIKIIACDIDANVPVKKIAKIRGEEFNRKGDGMLKKIRQIKRSLLKGFTIEQIINKQTTETYNKKPEAMSQVRFYTTEELNIMKTDIATGEPIHQISKRLSKEFDRPIVGLQQKLYLVKKEVPVIAKWNVPRVRRKMVKKTPVVEPVVEQQSADIGVEVPHGMTFEGKPKKIMLHSDHFRIYF